MLSSIRVHWAMVFVFLGSLWPASAWAAPTEPTDLGDLGYYYSAVGPYLESTVSVFNPGDAYSEAVLHLRNDIGTVVYTATQTIPPGEQWHFVPARVGLHGIFHGDVQSDGAPLAVYVSSQDTTRQELGAGYGAIRADEAAHAIALGVFEVGERAGASEAEVVVQNLRGTSTAVSFTLCPEDGLCFANNLAVLPGYGRRSFLLDRLAYSNRYSDGLVALSGMLTVTVAAEGDVAVVVNEFVAQDAQKAELGATAWTQVRAVPPADLGQAMVSSPAEGHSTIPQALRFVYLPQVAGNYQPLAERRCALPAGNGEWPCGVNLGSSWHLPFVAAPVVAFVEDRTNPLGVGYPWQGIQSTGRALDDWSSFSNLNWYNWRANGDWDSRLNQTLWTLCDSDPNYFPMVWSATVARNTVPSGCAGRPLLLVNEPELQYRRTPTWTDEAIADNVFRHHNWPGDLYCCGHVSWSGGTVESIAADSGASPTFGNILDAYQQRFGERMPIDGVHVHFYLAWEDIDIARQAPQAAAMTTLRDHTRRWVSYIEDNFGSDFPILVSEYGILSNGANLQTSRDIVKAGLDDFTALLVEELGTNLVRLYYFQVYWGGEKDPSPPMWLVSSDDDAYTLDEVNDVGAYFLSLVERHRRE